MLWSPIRPGGPGRDGTHGMGIRGREGSRGMEGIPGHRAGSIAFAVGLALVVLGGCGDRETGEKRPADAAVGGPWQEVAASRLTPMQADAVDRGLAARDAMFARLLGRLGEAMAAGGPAAAIDVCAEDAPRIADQVAEEFGVRIGRTSFKLRNPANRPPAWVEPAVLARRGDPVRFLGPEGTLGVLEPIMVMPTCLGCHGDADRLAPGVAEAVASRYPEDRATGFAAGDLRGWFWIEVPDAG